MKLNSVIFHTTDLKELRAFYEGILHLSTGTYLKDGQQVPDYSDSYVNYDIGGVLLCFEIDGDRIDLGTVVLNIENFDGLSMRLQGNGVKIIGGNSHYFKIKDPDGRSIIIEPIR